MKRKHIIWILPIAFIASVCVLFALSDSILFVIIYILLSICFLLLNTMVSWDVNRIKKTQRIDYLNDKRRDFDILVIGKPMVLANDGSKVLYFTHERRTLLSSYLFLIHNFSYLREDGEGLIIINTKDMECEDNYITIFDYKCFHPVINMKFGLNTRLLNAVPLLYCFRKFRASNYFEKHIDLMSVMTDFCKERNLKIQFIK